MPSIYLDLAGALVRGLLQMLFGMLIAHGLLTPAQSGELVLDLAPKLMGVLGILATLAWSGWRKWSAKRLQLVGRAMPSGSTEAAAQAYIASGAPVPSVLTPPDVSPGPVKPAGA